MGLDHSLGNGLGCSFGQSYGNHTDLPPWKSINFLLAKNQAAWTFAFPGVHTLGGPSANLADRDMKHSCRSAGAAERSLFSALRISENAMQFFRPLPTLSALEFLIFPQSPHISSPQPLPRKVFAVAPGWGSRQGTSRTRERKLHASALWEWG